MTTETRERIERLRAIEPSDYVGSAVVEVVWAFMGGNVSAMELRDTIIALLEQADPDTHMELPKDADGVPVHIGDELCGYGYPHGGAYCMAINDKDVIFVSELGSMSYKDMLLWDPRDCRHYHKPSVEDVLTEFVEKWHSTHYVDIPALKAEYAKRLRLAEVDE